MAEDKRPLAAHESQAKEERKEETTRSATMRPDSATKEGGVRDRAAQQFLLKQQKLAVTPPHLRAAEDHRMGTPQWIEENSPENMHSDGGSTLHYAEEDDVADLLDDDDRKESKRVNDELNKQSEEHGKKVAEQQKQQQRR